MADLVEQYRSFMESAIDDDGVEIAQAFIVEADGNLILMALAVPSEEAYRVVLAKIAGGAREAIFALDRYTKPGQGTKYADVLAGHYFQRRDSLPLIACFRPFVIEYRPNPRLVEGVCWDNAFWNDALRRELASVMGAAPVLRAEIRHG